MKNTSQLIFLYTLVATRSEAKRLATTLLSERLIACANILPPSTAMYVWKGKQHMNTEVPLLLKTQQRKKVALMRRLQHLHTYECPCIAVFRAEDASAMFSNWVADALQE